MYDFETGINGEYEYWHCQESRLLLIVLCNILKGCGLGMASGMALGLVQPETVISAIRAFYNGIQMILSIILFVAFIATFHLERDMMELRNGK